MRLTLHGIAGSRAIRCLWMLEELGVPYTHVPTDFRGQTRTPEFLALNPNGHIPVLQDDDLVVWESLAINLYLARRCGGLLAPDGHAEDAACLMWSFWAANAIERECVAILLHREALPEERRKPEAGNGLKGMSLSVQASPGAPRLPFTRPTSSCASSGMSLTPSSMQYSSVMKSRGAAVR